MSDALRQASEARGNLIPEGASWMGNHENIYSNPLSFGPAACGIVLRPGR